MADYQATVNIKVNGIEDLKAAEKTIDSLKSKAGSININLGGTGKGRSSGGMSDDPEVALRKSIAYTNMFTKANAANVKSSALLEAQESKIAASYQNSGKYMDEYKDAIDRMTEARGEYERSLNDENASLKTHQAYFKAYETALNSVAQIESKIKQNGGFAVDSQKVAQAQRSIATWANKNGKAMRVFGDDVKAAQSQLVDGISQADFNKVQTRIQNIMTEAASRNLLGETFGATLGKSFSNMWNTYGRNLLTYGTMRWVSSAVSELKNVDSILTEIQKVSLMTTTQLKDLGKTSFEAASKYGRTAQDYLYGVQQFSRAGFRGSQATDLAELSLKAQAAGDLTSDVANSYLLASSAAFGYGGNVEKLTELLDGQNWVADNNAVSMEDLAEATSKAASMASTMSVSEKELTALIGTAQATTQVGGQVVGTALRNLLINVNNLGNAKIVKLFDKLGISQTEMVGGKERMRDTMDILEDLAEVYNDPNTSNLLQNEVMVTVGQKRNANVLNAILTNWEMYEGMLQDYAEGTGSAEREAMMSANNWEGSLNKLSNTWTSFIGNFANSDTVITAIKGVTGALNALDGATAGKNAASILTGLTTTGLVFKNLASGIEKGAGLGAYGAALGKSLGWGAAIAVGSYALQSGLEWIDQQINHVKYGREDMNVAVERYQTSKKDLETTEQQLSTINAQISELEGRSALTFVEQSQLSQLKLVNAELEQTRLMQQQINQADQSAAVGKTLESWADESAKVAGKTWQQIAKESVDEIARTAAYPSGDQIEDWTQAALEFAMPVLDENSTAYDYMYALAGAQKYRQVNADRASNTLLSKEEVSAASQRVMDADKMIAEYQRGLSSHLVTVEGYIGNLRSAQKYTDSEGVVWRNANDKQEYEEMLSLAHEMDEQLRDSGYESNWRDFAINELMLTGGKAMQDQMKSLRDYANSTEAASGNINDLAGDYSLLTNGLAACGLTLQDFVDYLGSSKSAFDAAGNNVELLQAKFESFREGAMEAMSNVDNLNAAMASNASSKGLSISFDEDGGISGDVGNLMNMFSGNTSVLENGAQVYDTLFQRTASGIRLNTDALRALQSEAESLQKASFDTELKDLVNQLDEAREKLSRFDPNNEKDAPAIKAQNDIIKSIEEQIRQVKYLSAAYDGATSAYQKWIDAQSMGEEGNRYDQIQSTALSRGDELLEAGLIGTNEFRAIANLFSNEDLMTAPVDKLVEAYNAASPIVKDFFTEGREGADAFAEKMVEMGYATKEGNAISFAVDDVQKFADELGISVDLVEAMFGKMHDYGDDIKFLDGESVDEYNARIEEMTQKAEEAKDKLKGIAEESSTAMSESLRTSLENISNMDVDSMTSLDQVDDAIKTVENTIEEINNSDIDPQVQTDSIEAANAVMDRLVEKKNELSGTYDMPMTVSGVEDAIAKVQELQSLLQQAESLNAKGFNIDIEKDSGIQEVASEIAALPASVQIALGFTEPTNDPMSIISQLQESTANIPVDYTVGNQEEPQLEYDGNVHFGETHDEPPQSYTGNVHFTETHDTPPLSYTGTITYNIVTNGSIPSVNAANGSAHGYGTAHAGGNWGLPSAGRALMGELGTEIVVRDGHWFTVGNQGAEMVNLRRGDIVFNHQQTRSILQNGYVDGRGKMIGVNSLVGGTAYALANAVQSRLVADTGTGSASSLARTVNRLTNATVAAAAAAEYYDYYAEKAAESLAKGQQYRSTIATASAQEYNRSTAKSTAPDSKFYTSTSSGTGWTGTHNLGSGGGSGSYGGGGGGYGGGGGGGGSGGGGGGGGSGGSGGSSQEYDEKFDWIEILISRIEEKIEDLERTADSVFNTTSVRNKALQSEMSKITYEIDVQQQAADRYLEEANKVGLDETWAKYVRDGMVEISRITNEELGKQIEEYQKWYDKSREAQSAAADLREELKELYQTMFENTQKKFEDELGVLERRNDVLEEYIDLSEAQGKIVGAAFYQEQIRNDNETLKKLQKERAQLNDLLSTAVATGKIAVGSEAWYEMSEAIDEVSQSIAETSTHIQEMNNELRQIKWDIFDDMQDRISDITAEADFLGDIMGEAFDETGKMTRQGRAALGLQAISYDAYMTQSLQYANEIRAIDKQLAKDPNNKDLLKRRQDLLEAQRKNIKAAEDEKKAMKNLIKEGIDAQLKSLKELISEYTKMLDTQKNAYDYQRNVTEKQKEISSLEKQLAAYAGDTSEEGMANRQRLRSSLTEAREDLQQTQEDKRISETKQMLNDLYDEYQEVMNERLDNLDQLVADVIANVNDNKTEIANTLRIEAANVGYKLTDNMNNVIDKSGTMVTDMGALISSSINQNTLSAEKAASVQNRLLNALFKTSDDAAEKRYGNVYTVIMGIKAYTDKALEKANKEAQEKLKAEEAAKKKEQAELEAKRKAEEAAAKKKAEEEAAKKKKAEEEAAKKKKEEEKKTEERSGRSGDKWRDWDSGSGWGGRGGGGGWGGRGWASGVEAAPEGLFWTNEGKPETIIRKRDGAILTALSAGDMVLDNAAHKNLWSLVQNPESFIQSATRRSSIGANAIGFNTEMSADIDLTFNLPNVSNYREFVTEMQSDPKFEKLVQEMTLGRAMGRGSLRKNEIKM